MKSIPTSVTSQASTRGQRLCAYGVHLYTASGVAFAFLAAAETCAAQPDPRWVFVWLTIAGLIDATDGPLARRCQVSIHTPHISGRTIDDIVDYLTYTFLPLLLVWRMQWLPSPAWLWVIPAMMASLFGFGNARAKEEGEGFFRGFPSYWNIVAFYIGVIYTYDGPYLPAVMMTVFTILTVLPVRFLYPNLAPKPWRGPLLAGAGVWLMLLLLCLPVYPRVPAWLLWLSFVYPLWYTVLSIFLDFKARQRRQAHLQ